MSEIEISQRIPDSPSPAERIQITLQVGERRFTTTRETLTDESGFFSSLLSGRWDNLQADGSYFIDADGTLFEHILRFCRRGIFPVCYDNAKGHDHALYLALLEEAKYFQIPRLEKWLKDKSYLQAVKVVHSVVEVEALEDLAESTGADVVLEYHPIWSTRKVYVCPRDITLHRGNPGACGRLCKKVQGEAEDEYIDEEFVKVLVTRREIIYSGETCINGDSSF